MIEGIICPFCGCLIHHISVYASFFGFISNYIYSYCPKQKSEILLCCILSFRILLLRAHSVNETEPPLIPLLIEDSRFGKMTGLLRKAMRIPSLICHTPTGKTYSGCISLKTKTEAN